MGLRRTKPRSLTKREIQTQTAKLGQAVRQLRPPMIANEQTTDVERTRSLLLSSLRYWEVERDLIDERLAALRERQE